MMRVVKVTQKRKFTDQLNNELKLILKLRTNVGDNSLGSTLGATPFNFLNVQE